VRAARRKRLQRRQLVTMADDGHDFLVEMLHGHRRYIAEFLQQLVSAGKIAGLTFESGLGRPLDKVEDADDLIENFSGDEARSAGFDILRIRHRQERKAGLDTG